MAIANIVLADAQATPVNHTFVFVGTDANGVLRFEDQSAASPIGYWSITIGLKRPAPATAGASSANRNYRAEVRLTMPILENVTNSTVSGIQPAPTISYVLRASDGEFTIPERASLQNRKDLRKMYAALLAEAQVTALLETLVKPY